MKFSIVQYILSLFNKEAVDGMVARTGETSFNVNKALEAIVPLILKGFAAKAQEGPEQVNHLLTTANEAIASSWWQQAANWFTGSQLENKGKEILRDIFGNSNIQRVADSVASKTSVKPSSAMTLMQMAAPLCIGGLGKQISADGLNASGLAAWLTKEQHNFGGHQIAAAPAPVNTYTTDSPQKGSSRMWVAILLLAVAAALIWLLLKSCNKDTADSVPPTDTTQKAPLPEAPVAATITAPKLTLNPDSTLTYIYGDSITEKLPNGTELRLPNNSSEELLLTKIREAMAKGLDTTEDGKKNGWINLYDVQFSKGLAYRSGAAAQIGNIATILKAYPGVHIKIGGYTDNTGPDAVNQQLSGERASKVAKDLEAGGVSTQLEKAEGYGPQFPVADNATAEGRAQNRRVSCRIVTIQ